MRTDDGDYPAPSADAIRQSIDVLFSPDDVIEIRAIGSDRTEFGYFDPAHREDLIRAVMDANRGRSNLYFPINSVLPDLLARSANRMRRAGKRDAATGDAGIARRTWLPIDIDPERPSGISATDEEKQAARHVARVVVGYLRSLGWPDPVIGDSGNGIHVLYRIDLQADDGARDLVRSVLIALAERFDTPAAKVDRSVYNAARIWKIYGTVACKGDHVPGRPHRAAALLQVPDTVGLVTEDMLRSFIVQAGAMNGDERPERRNGTHHPVASPFQAVNEAAMARLGAWVPALLPAARPYHDGWRVAASDLDRGLEEDVSFVSDGIRDFGQEDGLSPIDAVMRFGGHTRPAEAAQWLAGQLGMAWEVRGRQGPAGEPQEAPATGSDGAPGDEIPIEAYMDDSPQRAPAVKAPPMDWQDLAQRDAPAREWLIDGWLGRGHPTLFVGPGGVGKSLLAQQLSASLAVMEPLLADVVSRPLRVLMWMCEDDHDELWRRQVAISHWLQRPLSDFQNLVIVPRLGIDNTLLTTEYGRPMWTLLINELREQCGDYQADVWVGDNIGQMFGGNENARHDVTMFINGVSGACGKTTPILLGHPSRGSGSEFSGSSAWENAVRMRWWFSDRLPDEKEPDSDVERDPSVRFLSKRKTNYSVKDYRQFQWREGVFYPHVDPTGIDDPYREAQAKRLVIHGIQRLASMDIYTSEKTGQNYLPAMLLKYGLNDGVPAGVIGRAMRTLLLDGKIARKEVGKNAARMPKYGLLVC